MILFDDDDDDAPASRPAPSTVTPRVGSTAGARDSVAGRRQVVLERRTRAPREFLDPPDLDEPRGHPLVRSPYLTAEEAAVYVRSATVRAFYKWRVKYGVPACRAGRFGKLLFLRRDLDDALKPPALRGHRSFFVAPGRRRGA